MSRAEVRGMHVKNYDLFHVEVTRMSLDFTKIHEKFYVRLLRNFRESLPRKISSQQRNIFMKIYYLFHVEVTRMSLGFYANTRKILRGFIT